MLLTQADTVIRNYNQAPRLATSLELSHFCPFQEEDYKSKGLMETEKASNMCFVLNCQRVLLAF